MKIGLIQINPTVGDLAGNSERLPERCREAAASGAELLVTSELVLSGYPPKDLLVRDGFVDECAAAVRRLAEQLPAGVGVIVGHPGRDRDGHVANAASLLVDGNVIQTVFKDSDTQVFVFGTGKRQQCCQFEI